MSGITPERKQGSYSYLQPNFGFEYRLTPTEEAERVLRFYGKQGLGLVSADVNERDTVTALQDEIQLLREQNPGKNMVPYLTVNFSDDLNRVDLEGIVRKMSTKELGPRRMPSTSFYGLPFNAYSDEELNRRAADETLEPEHLTLRALIIHTDEDGNLDSRSGSIPRPLLYKPRQARAFARENPGRVLANMLDLTLVSAMLIYERDPLFCQNDPTRLQYWERHCKTHAMYLPFLREMRNFEHPMVEAWAYPENSGEVHVKDERHVGFQKEITLFDSVGITQR